MEKFDFLNLDKTIQIADIGASAINEQPSYTELLVRNIAHLSAFDGDKRQIEGMKRAFGDNFTLFEDFLFDGTTQTVYIADPSSGMTSLYKPNPRVLRFFNGFDLFGRVEQEVKVQTRRLDDVPSVPFIDFIKMDIQGAELTVLKNGTQRLKDCVAIQLEVSFINLYKDQPMFGEVDSYLRSQGFAPHMFVDIKRWSIAPTVFQNNFRIPGNQLLEADVVYIKDPIQMDKFSDQQLKKLFILAHFCFRSVDLCVHLLLALEKRKVIKINSHQRYLSDFK